MKINKKMFIVLVSVFFLQLSSFAFGVKETMDNVMSSWVGENIESVIKHWGYPTDEKNIAGKKLYYWLHSSFSVSGNQYYMSGGEDTCNRILEVDRNNNVINWQWDGNSCPVIYFTAKKFVNPNNDPWKNKRDL